MWICHNCSEKIGDNFNQCWQCQYDREGNPPEKEFKEPADQGKPVEPFRAAFLNFIYPGLGYAYSGNLLRGLIFIIILFMTTKVFLLFLSGIVNKTLLFFLLLVLYMVSMVDAYRYVQKANAADKQQARFKLSLVALYIGLSFMVSSACYFLCSYNNYSMKEILFWLPHIK